MREIPEKPLWRLSMLGIVIALAALVGTSTGAGADSALGTASTIWAGVGAHSPSGSYVTSVTSSWYIPGVVPCSSSTQQKNAMSLLWVGLGGTKVSGVGPEDLYRVGTAQGCVDGRLKVVAFAEDMTNPGALRTQPFSCGNQVTCLSADKVQYNDKITAKVTSDGGTIRWTLQARPNTGGRGWSRTQSWAAQSVHTGECILEDPPKATLANLAQFVFNPCEVGASDGQKAEPLYSVPPAWTTLHYSSSKTVVTRSTRWPLTAASASGRTEDERHRALA